MEKAELGRASVYSHEGKKYLKKIRPADGGESTFHVDVYNVLDAFEVHCPACQHAIKKLLAAGNRGKGDRLADLKGALAAVNRAIDLEEQKNGGPTSAP